MEFSKVINDRHAVRFFKNQEVPTKLLNKIVRLAQRSLSWGNSQPWKVYLATNQCAAAIRQKFIKLGQEGSKAIPTYQLLTTTIGRPLHKVT